MPVTYTLIRNIRVGRLLLWRGAVASFSVATDRAPGVELKIELTRDADSGEEAITRTLNPREVRTGDVHSGASEVGPPGTRYFFSTKTGGLPANAYEASVIVEREEGNRLETVHLPQSIAVVERVDYEALLNTEGQEAFEQKPLLEGFAASVDATHRQVRWVVEDRGLEIGYNGYDNMELAAVSRGPGEKTYSASKIIWPTTVLVDEFCSATACGTYGSKFSADFGVEGVTLQVSGRPIVPLEEGLIHDLKDEKTGLRARLEPARADLGLKEVGVRVSTNPDLVELSVFFAGTVA